jgi:hypothetical protein
MTEWELKHNICKSLLEKPGFSGKNQQVRLLPDILPMWLTLNTLSRS